MFHFFPLPRYFRGRAGVGAECRLLHKAPSLGPPPEYRGRGRDSEREYVIAWCAKIGRIKKIRDLFKPKCRGNLELLSQQLSRREDRFE
jgi:hypothetical protein